jgi:16S rRNA (cytosine967-C5)-methyltransferase
VTTRLTGPVSPARRAAFDTLTAVWEGQYASDVLREHSRALEGRDAGLAAQIVFGVLRYQAQLDYLIKIYSNRQVHTLDRAVTIALRTAIFQLRYLERIPAHAAVHETVELIKRHKRSAAGLVNAVLRKVRRNPMPWPDRAIELSCPDWILKRWTEHFGQEQAFAIAKAALTQPIPYIRIPPGTESPPGLAAEPTAVSGAFRLPTPLGADASLNDLRLHDISSQAVLPLLQLQPGNSYLDLCAAPGNKTRQALETALGLAVACDISLKRIGSIPPICPRVVLDGTKPLPFSRPFDRIFIDAPCSGTGTIGRNPEIKWRVQEQDFRKFGERQVELVLRGVGVLAPGGKLLYATCSLEREENEDVVTEVQRLQPEIRVEDMLWRIPGRDEGDGFFAALLSVQT